MFLLGYDIGSSSVKTALVETQTGRIAASAFYPKREMPIAAPRADWAEQDPAMWWDNLRLATADVMQQAQAKAADIEAIGISYQMHGLVCVDKAGKPLRPAIIWCDSRATRRTGNERPGSRLLPGSPAELARQLHCIETRMGQEERTAYI